MNLQEKRIWFRENQGKTRICTKFLIFPKKIGNKIKWLKNATWEERAWYVNHTFDMDIEEYFGWSKTK